MAQTRKDTRPVVRQSVSLPSNLAFRVKTIAKAKRLSASRVLQTLVERGLEAQDREKEMFLALADKLTRSKDTEEQERLKEQLARLTFGD